MEQVREMRRLTQATEKPEMNYFFDVRESVARIRLENTHLEENELWDLRRSLETIGIIVTFLRTSPNLPKGEEPFSPPLEGLGEVCLNTSSKNIEAASCT
jgi:DNA mismatch repair protein MutS2